MSQPLGESASLLDSPKQARAVSSLNVGASSPERPRSRTSLLASVEPRRVLNALSITCMAYFAVSAGPFGIEPAVAAAGALPTLVGIVVLPLMWGLPQALMTAELSTMIDENGGYVIWVKRGLGDFAGWMNAYNSLFSNMLDLPTYPVLLSSYVQSTLLPDLTPLHAWMVRLTALACVIAVNARGINAVSKLSFVFTLVVVPPFLLQPALAAGRLDPAAWLRTVPSIDWSTFVSIMLWKHQGWTSLGCVAGEVKEGGVAYPLGVSAAMVLITVTYMLPVATGVCIQPAVAAWAEGTLASLASATAAWLGTWVLAAAGLSTLAQFNVMMSTTSRAMWSMAKLRMLPRALGLTHGPHAVPVAAMLLQSAACALLMTQSFSQLVLIDTFFNNVSLLMELAAFVALRHTEPHTPRPYIVPYGTAGMWLVTVPKVVVLLGSMVLMGWRAWVLCAGVNVALALAFLLWRRWNPHVPSSTRDPQSPAVDAAGSPRYTTFGASP